MPQVHPLHQSLAEQETSKSSTSCERTFPPLGVKPEQHGIKIHDITTSPSRVQMWCSTPSLFWLVCQHIPEGPLHASSPVSAEPTLPGQRDLGNINFPPTQRVPRRWESCTIYCPCHAFVMTNKQVLAPTMTCAPPEVPSKGRGRWCCRGGGSLVARMNLRGQAKRPGTGVLGLYGNVMGDCETAVRPYSCRQSHHQACDGQGVSYHRLGE